MRQYDKCGPNMFLKIYDSTDAHIGAVISHLFYRIFVKMLPDYQIPSKPIKSIEHLLRNWTGGRHSRISKQPIVYTEHMELHPDPVLSLEHVLFKTCVNSSQLVSTLQITAEKQEICMGCTSSS